MPKSKSAIDDGQKARAFKRVKGRKVYTSPADDVIATIKRHVRKTMGDWMGDHAKIFANHGTFFVKLPYRRPLNAVADDFWRRAFKEGIRLRRHSIGLALRAMHGEVLT